MNRMTLFDLPIITRAVCGVRTVIRRRPYWGRPQADEGPVDRAGQP
jgi:hypothetical protein